MCWVKGCDGNHSAYVHPVHNCRPPSVNARHWTCTCGKHWAPTAHGWRLVEPDPVE